jgi:predicted secreted protein
MNVEAQGSSIAFYAPVNGTETLVAARRSLELSEDADTLDATHADNMRVGGAVTNVSTNTLTVESLSTKELERGQRGEVFGTDGSSSGKVTWSASDVTDNGDGTHDVTVNESLGGSEAMLYVPAPHGSRVYKYNFNEWAVDLENVLLIDKDTGSFEASHRALVEAKRHGRIIATKIKRPSTDGSTPGDEGDGIVTDLTLTSPYNELATVSISVQGEGPLTSIQ